MFFLASSTQFTEALLESESCHLLVRLLIFSCLDYSNLLLLCFKDKHLKILQRIQNCSCRFIYQLHPVCSVTADMLGLHWLPARERIQHKILYNPMTVPCYLHVFTEQQIRARRPHDLKLTVPRRTAAFGLKSFDTRGAVLWNSLPVKLRTTESYPLFKRDLRTHFFRSYYYWSRRSTSKFQKKCL